MDHSFPQLRCSVGVTAYNEEANIGRLLDALLNQNLRQVYISEIIVVASGCTDDTVPIVERYVAANPCIRLFVQPKREGKTAAINVFLTNAVEDICVLESGDTLPHEDAVEHLVRMFQDPTVGMTGRAQDAGQHPGSPRRPVHAPATPAGTPTLPGNPAARRDDRVPQGIRPDPAGRCDG